MVFWAFAKGYNNVSMITKQIGEFINGCPWGSCFWCWLLESRLHQLFDSTLKEYKKKSSRFQISPWAKKGGEFAQKNLSWRTRCVASTLSNCPVWLWFMMVFHPHGAWIMDVTLLFTGRRRQVHKDYKCNPCKWYNRLCKRISVRSVICHIWGHSL
jgi:hypothetical protein